MRIRAWWLAVALPVAAIGQPLVNQPAGPVGPPASIELVVVSGNPIRDHIHAQYAPGQTVQAKVVVRDANNNVLAEPVAGCTPKFQVQGTFGGGQGTIDAAQSAHTATVKFEKSGVFSVSAHCEEDPEISTEGGHHPPYNFETSNSPFAIGAAPAKTVAERVAAMKAAMGVKPAEPTPPAAPATPDPASGKKTGLGVGALLLALGGGYLISKALSPDEESDCSCTCTKSKHDCKHGGSTYCRQVSGGDMFNICNCTYPCSPEPRVVTTVDELVATGLARERAHERQIEHIRSVLDAESMVQRSGWITERLRGVRPRAASIEPANGVSRVVGDAPITAAPRHVRIQHAFGIAAGQRAKRTGPVVRASSHRVVASTSAATRHDGPIVGPDRRRHVTHLAPSDDAWTLTSIVSTFASTAAGWLQETDREPSITVTPWAEPGGGGITLGGRF